MSHVIDRLIDERDEYLRKAVEQERTIIRLEAELAALRKLIKRMGTGYDDATIDDALDEAKLGRVHGNVSLACPNPDAAFHVKGEPK